MTDMSTKNPTQIDEFSAWLERYGRSEGTVNQYVHHVKRALASDPIKRLTNKKLAPKTRRSIKAALLSWADFTKNEELREEIRRVKLPAAHRQKQRPILNDEQWKKMIEALPKARVTEPVRAILGILLTRGMRKGDVLRIRRSEILDALKSDILLYEAKGARRLEFPLTSSWRPFVEVLAEHQDYDRVWELVCRPGSQKVEQSAGRAVIRALRKVAKKCGIEPRSVHPHLLRKMYATKYYRLCKDPHKLMHHMQWTNIETAMRYVQVDDRATLDSIAEKMFD